MDVAEDPIRIFLDDQTEPFHVAEPPIRFNFNTIHLADGDHVLRVEASNGLGPPTVRLIPFCVRNGVAVTVSGLQPGQTIGGQVELIINAYAGNTEVDFEPRRAETPQPVPTWAWVLLLAVGAWGLYYLLAPKGPLRELSHIQAGESVPIGERIYVDTCARCHGEDGRGRRDASAHSVFPVAALRDTKDLSVAEHPFRLLARVIAGVPGTQMPAWGPLLENEELIAAVNHVRTAWGHDAATIRLRFRSPPKAIEILECHLTHAIRTKDPEQMAAWGWPEGSRPILFRSGDDRGGTIGREDVTARWADYFTSLCDGEVTDIQLREVRYDYEPETVGQDGAYVIAVGRIYQETLTDLGEMEAAKGRFIRVYQNRRGMWGVVLDFADIPFNVGCPPEFQATAESRAAGIANGTGTPAPGAGDAPGAPGAPAAGAGAATSDLGYAEVKELLAGLGKSARTAPHGNFWDEDYQPFIDFEFTYESPAEVFIRMIVPWDSRMSNLIRGLRGEPILACSGGTNLVELSVRRMPVGVAPMSDADTARIAAWIDAGCPEVAGTASTLPKRPALEVLCKGGAGDAPPPAAGPGGRRQHAGCASMAPEAAAALGFRDGRAPLPPGGDEDAGGFPPPSDGGFPEPDGGGFPAPDGGSSSPDNGFPPPDDGFPPPDDAASAPR